MNPSNATRCVRRAAACALVLFTVRAADAQYSVLHFSLEEMVATADRIFIGRCAAIESGTASIAQGQLPVTRYTFDIEQALKGDVPAQITWTQPGVPPRPAVKHGPVSHGQVVQSAVTLHGSAAFEVGDRMLVFLTPEYGDGRLSYPVGLDQGVFALQADDSGQAFARNAAGRAVADAHGPVPLARLVELIRQIHAARGGAPGAVRNPNGGRP